MDRFKAGCAAALVAALGLAAPQAAAQSPRDRVVQTIVDVIKAGGGKEVSYARVVGDDARFTIEGLKAIVEIEEAGTKKDGAIAIGRLTLTGARPTPAGGYTAADISGEEIKFAADDSTMSIDTFRATDIVEPPPSAVKPGALYQPGRRFSHVEAGGIGAGSGEGGAVRIDSLSVEARDWRETFAGAGSVKIAGIHVPLEDPDAAAQLQELGYDRFVLDFDSAARWDETAGRLAVSDFAFTARDMGVLRLSGTFGGLTKEVMAQLQALESGENEKALEVLQGLTIADFKIRFENRSIVEKALAYAAKQQGVKSQDIVTQTAQDLPLILTALNNKAFEQKIANAVTAFLNAPKSIAAIARPTQPIPVSQIFGTALAAPQTLPNLLNVDVTANQQ